MEYLRPLGLLMLVLLSLVQSLPSDVTTARSPPMVDTIKQLTNQLMELNATSTGVMTFDTRTPPKVKQQQKQKIAKEPIENSHAGVAIPVSEDEIDVDITTKKVNFQKIERPTTNSGLSTWILLSGQSTTTKAPKKPVIKPLEDKRNMTIMVTEVPPRIVKPIFKKRTTTRKPPVKNVTEPTEHLTTTAPVVTTTATLKLTKIKASVLNNAVYKRNHTVSTKKHPILNTTEKTTTTKKIKTTTQIVPIKNANDTDVNAIDSNILPLEAKNEEVDIPTTTEVKTKKTTKRKKNKTRRRKPADKTSNNTKVEKQKIVKEKPIGTQLYNYLSREVMPTVGVGMVGLLVTAGLASYFLYPFGAARRSYDINRRDKEGSYYYNDGYSGGIAEEEAIGKVIAGMPSNALYGNSYKSRNNYPSTRYRQVDRRSQIQSQNFAQGKVESVQASTKPPLYDNNYAVPPNYKSDSYQPITYNLNNQDLKFTVDEQKFVVGNVPKEYEDVTPVTVPEHGPRSLKIRRRRSNQEENEIDNEIFSTLEEKKLTTTEDAITEPTTVKAETPTKHQEETTTRTTAVPSTTTEKLPDKITSFLDLLKDMLHLKVNLGLQLIKNATQSVSTYVTRVQNRLDEHYRNYTESRNKNKRRN